MRWGADLDLPSARASSKASASAPASGRQWSGSCPLHRRRARRHHPTKSLQPSSTPLSPSRPAPPSALQPSCTCSVAPPGALLDRAASSPSSPAAGAQSLSCLLRPASLMPLLSGPRAPAAAVGSKLVSAKQRAGCRPSCSTAHASLLDACAPAAPACAQTGPLQLLDFRQVYMAHRQQQSQHTTSPQDQ